MKKIQLKEKEYLSVHKQAILEILDKNKTILIDSNPGTGKTSLFVEIGIDIKENKRKGRLIFCAPFLIIQSQFSVALKERKHSIDLVLNANSERKKLIETDKIISSTYQSLKHIANSLNEDDIIVLDEAHSLTYSYKNFDKRTYFEKEISLFLNTSAKLVLMTGTPSEEVNKLFNLTHIQVRKEDEKKANISLYNSNHDETKIAIEFARSAIRQFGSGYLNTIFINNTVKCEKINKALNDLEYKSRVLTSHHKKEDLYDDLVHEMIINPDIDFLICTSVISTGANIKNKNIGMALVLFESNPKEIKQFSKRFRQKLDIHIHVVNKAKAIEDNSKNISTIKSDLTTISKLINTFESSDIPDEYLNTFDISDIATKSAIIKDLIKRYLMQTYYLEQLRANYFITPSKLKEELNKYSDINAMATEMPQEVAKVLSPEKVKDTLNNLACEFIKNPKEFSYEIINGTNIDKFVSYLFDNKIGQHLNLEDVKSNDKIVKLIKSPYFEQKILVPVIENFEYFKSLKETIYLNSHLSTLKFNRLKQSLIISSFIKTHLNINRVNNDYEIIRSPEVIITDKKDEALIELIKLIFDFCLKKKIFL
ncbi:DEAD/DEAH box helicase family protein [Tenacibaculum retecalamus]|uniref:DEAD/DEAH box helicase family protein n=1 Tax=Tenacibaculum retecalamus TaxID=3018315 RepID=UPI0023D90F5D|nr:DEAD/DEAH box helicase family protein [Tenacibaculum retecalamus]WBX72012.1 DEAD/DEAH box helicase family protein [Tenacibaculum retecalamus]